MTEINAVFIRERRKRAIFAAFCFLVGSGTIVSMITWRVYPPAAYFLSGIPAAAFLATGAYHLRAVLLNRIEPTRDQRFLANVLWTTALCAFPALIVVGVQINGQANATTDAILHGIIGLALIAASGVYKVVVAINEAELRLRERLLALRIGGD